MALLVAHITLLEISCRGSFAYYNILVNVVFNSMFEILT